MSQHQTGFTMEKALPAAEAGPRLKLPPEPASPVPAISTDRPEPARRRRLRPLLFAGVAIAALAGAADFGWRYWTTGRFTVATDNAYVKADSTTIAPKISGYIAAVLVGDNETVRAGQVLARVDDRDFKVGLAQAGAQVEAARANIATRKAALAAQFSVIDAARATLEADKADETFAEQNNDRYAQLAKSGYGSIQNAQLATSRIGIARAAVARDTAALASAVRQLDVIKAELAQAQAALDGAKAAQDQAALSLSYTALVAPVDRVVGNRSLRVGQYVQAGTQLMAVVPTGAAYIVANYKETQLTEVRAGQKVMIEVDTYPGQVFRGRVDSLSPASGQEFALLPPDNATGNFTKVVQRIPVTIVLDRQGPLPVVLRPGMSVYPRIDTRPETTEVAQASGQDN
ncbi:HlyD family secretion protein [Hyphomicrobiales bacterium]|nr:HlyD family secretion protein [Hyphomicrobiales bacterium]CAH1698746.1 HlyD family secretion protein [Hyphomicrobiales bacterium]CAI0342394.1 membrane fusion protein, multidrug efflux system [Hyphomicrobiales bacterium]